MDNLGLLCYIIKIKGFFIKNTTMNLKSSTYQKILFTITLILFSSLLYSQNENLVKDWDGNGKVGVGSEPNNFGWDCTNFQLDGWTEAGSGGVRYMDSQNYWPSKRLMFVRWDGVGGSNAESVYSYPVDLEAYKSYMFSVKYTRHSNSTTNFVIGVNSEKDNSGESLASESVAPLTQNFKELSFRIVPNKSGRFYITIGASASGMLGSIADLSVVEITPSLESEKGALVINYFKTETTTTIYNNGSEYPITFTAPDGIEITPATLSSTGGVITISSPNKVNLTGEIIVSQGEDNISININSNFPEDFFPTVEIDTLTTDGAWCWFADPRSLYHSGEKEQTYFCWVTREGHIEVASYNHTTEEYSQYRIWEYFQDDDHANPSLLIRDDGRIIVFIAAHFGDKIHRFITENPEDITSWGERYSFSNTVTYPYPFQVGDDIYVFYRGGSDWHPRLSVSSDNGETFDDGRLFISGGGQRPYTRYCQGEDGAIHVAVTTGHPRNEAANKVHYCKLIDNKVYRADGTFIKDVTTQPVDISQLEVVYDGVSYGKGWIWDITLEPETGYPVMVYASFPTDTDHRYHYGKWDGNAWKNNQITEAGRWFPQTPEGGWEPEPNYSGGIILDYNNPNVVYLSKEVNGVFEIFKFTTNDDGNSWTPKAITWDSPADIVNVRPIIPRHHKEGYFDVVWMRGTYVFYANNQYNTALVFPKASPTADVSKVSLSNTSLELIQNESKKIEVSFYPAFATDKVVTWSSSNESVATVENGVVTAVNKGVAKITATSLNGVSAECDVTVQTVELMNNVFFDFGTVDSPVENGFIKISDLTDLVDSYGWLNNVASRNRNISNSELRDFNMSSAPAIFKVYVENGEYEITVKQGDSDFGHDMMNLRVNGELKLENVTANDGEFKTNIFNFTVENNILEFEFYDGGGSDANWVVNSIIIKKLASTIIKTDNSLDFKNSNTDIVVNNLMGNILYKGKLNNRDFNQVCQNLNLSKGIYFITLILENNKKTFKYLYLNS